MRQRHPDRRSAALRRVQARARVRVWARLAFVGGVGAMMGIGPIAIRAVIADDDRPRARGAIADEGAPAAAPASASAAGDDERSAQTRPEVRPTGAWLDAALPNWNEGLKSVPAPVKTGDAGPIDARCKDQIRTGNSSEDRLVSGAGWTLVGARQTFNDVTLVTAMTATDGMCRPVGYQAFVFVGGTFAGTLSPVPMDSRTDGMVDRIFLTMPDRVTAEFRRYKDSDALCCPSGGSGVSYRVERKGGRPVLVPEQATATPK